MLLIGGEVLHAKSYVFDRCWSIVGSANLDFQSLQWIKRSFVERVKEKFFVLFRRRL